MSDSEVLVVVPESPPPPRRSARTARAKSAPKESDAVLSDDDVVALDAPPITPAQSSSTRRPRKKRVSDDEVVFLRESPKPKSSTHEAPRPRIPLKDRFTYAGVSAPRSRVKRVANTEPGRALSPVPVGQAVAGPSVTSVLLPPRDDPPLPVPEWLGRTSVLLRLNDCPVCRRHLKKSDAGPARWVRLSRKLELTPAPHLYLSSDRIPSTEPGSRSESSGCGSAPPRARDDIAGSAHARCLGK